MKIQLGQTVRDIITGFTGVVTGHVEYITGCNQALVAPKIKDDGSAQSPGWYDDARLEVLPVAIVALAQPVEVPPKTPGFDVAAPAR